MNELAHDFHDKFDQFGIHDEPVILLTSRHSKTVPVFSRFPSLRVFNMAATVSKQNNSACKFAILGGGISGLAAAYRLLNRVKDPSNITLLESSNRVGGWMQSCTTEQGAVFEMGPRSIRPHGKVGMATLKIVSNTV